MKGYAIVMADFKDAIELINQSKKIAVLPHVSADGDAIGSTMALYYLLCDLGKEAVIYIEEPIQRRYENLTKGVNFIIYTKGSSTEQYDLCIAADCGDKARLGTREEIFDKALRRISIDHHQSNTNFADINYVNTSWCATSEAVFLLIKESGLPVTRDMAKALYMGILTDTGGFRHSNTTSDTHKIAAELIETGIDVTSISQQVYDAITVGKLKLIGVLASNTEFYENGKIALCYINNSHLEACGATDEDIDGLCDYLRNIDSVEVGVLIKNAANGSLKVNLRSKEYVDVNIIAGELGGGGHKRAAGLVSGLTIEELKNELISKLKAEIDKYGWNNSN